MSDSPSLCKDAPVSFPVQGEWEQHPGEPILSAFDHTKDSEQIAPGVYRLKGLVYVGDKF